MVSGSNGAALTSSGGFSCKLPRYSVMLKISPSSPVGLPVTCWFELWFWFVSWELWWFWLLSLFCCWVWSVCCCCCWFWPFCCCCCWFWLIRKNNWANLCVISLLLTIVYCHVSWCLSYLTNAQNWAAVRNLFLNSKASINQLLSIGRFN